MQAVIFGFMMPLIPLFVWKLYHREEKLTVAQAIERYVIYTLLTTLFSTVVMALVCDDNTSFLEKMDQLPMFALKFVFIEAVAVTLIAVTEWSVCTGRVALEIEGGNFRNMALCRFCRKVLFPAGIFLVALLVVYLNAALINDNVVWGDEAYSGNAIRNSVAGIFQILTLEENHPPLYYLWLKGFAEVFGYSTPVYHFASFVPFCIGIVLAVFFLRRHYGNIPAAFFVILSGLAAPCVEYNMEIRMYELAFLGLAGCYYCVSRIMSGSKVMAWIGMVFWALVAAYSHYYALVAAGIMVFVAGAAAWVRYRGRVWIKGLLSLAIFCVAYAPWLGQLFRATESVSRNWWMTEIESLQNSVTMIGCGRNMCGIVLPVLLLLVFVLFAAESSVIQIGREDDKFLVHVAPPTVEKWSDETYALAVGGLTIAGTVAFAYGISIAMRPLVAVRYFYPLCAITISMLVFSSHRLIQVLREAERHFGRKGIAGLGKCALLLLLAVLFTRGISDYRAYRNVVKEEDARTAEVLYYIGEPDENTQFINNGVQHIGWTVLDYYYPETEVINGMYTQADADTVWYFTPEALNEQQFNEINELGYSIPAIYHGMQLGKYHFVLYRFEKIMLEPGSGEKPAETKPESGEEK